MPRSVNVRMLCCVVFLALMSGAAPVSVAVVQSGYFVAPHGTPQGDGTIERPLDLATVLGASSPLQSGQTAWLTTGEYRGDYDTSIAGSAGQYVTLRALAGARLDGSITTRGAWVTIWGLEIYDADLNRQSAYSGSNPPDIVGKDGLTVYGEHTRLINNVIHDVRQGVGFWSTALDSEMSGNVIYNVGWAAPDRPHGHSAYVQNRDPNRPKRLAGNVLVNTFAENNLAIYASAAGFTRGVTSEGNIIIGGTAIFGSDDNIVARRNHVYGGRANFAGRTTWTSTPNVVIEDNRFYTARVDVHALSVSRWFSAIVTGNTVVAQGNANPWLVETAAPQPEQATWSGNSYRYPGAASWYRPFVQHGVRSYNLAEWQALLGYDMDSTYSAVSPVSPEVFVTRNEYEPGRGVVVVYNWPRLDSVAVDLTPLGLTVGRSYRLRVAQDYEDSAVSFVHDGSPLVVPMTGWSVAQPLGWAGAWKPSTFPQFGVFVVEAQ